MNTGDVEENKLKIFISYASVDKDIAFNLCDLLEKSGFLVFIAPRDISPGKDYAGEIIHGIDNSKMMLLLLSSNSNKSKHVIREVERAVKKDLILIPIRIEDIEPSKSLEYYCATSQWFDAFKGSPDQFFPQLIRNIKKHLNGEMSQVIVDNKTDLSKKQKSEQTKYLFFYNKRLWIVFIILIISIASFAIYSTLPGRTISQDRINSLNTSPSSASNRSSPIETQHIIATPTEQLLNLNGSITISTGRDNVFNVGDPIQITGKNTVSKKTYLYVTGNSLPESRLNLQNFSILVDSNLPDSFIQTDVGQDGTWNYLWNTNNVTFISGQYLLNAVPMPVTAKKEISNTHAISMVFLKAPVVYRTLDPNKRNDDSSGGSDSGSGS